MSNYNVLEDDVFVEKVKQIVEWTKTSLDSLETDDVEITYQCGQVAILCGRVSRDLAEVDRRLDLLEATKYASYREQRENLQGGKVTEKQIEADITRDEEVQEMRSLLGEMKSRLSTVERLWDTLNLSKRQWIERNKARIDHEIKMK